MWLKQQQKGKKSNWQRFEIKAAVYEKVMPILRQSRWKKQK